MIRRALASLALVFAAFTGGEALSRCEDYVPGVRPQNVGREDVGRDYDAIIESGFIEFAVYEAFPPFSYREDGDLKGVDIEIGRLIAEDMGVEPRFNEIGAAEDVDGDLRNAVWKGPLIGGRVSNVMLHVPYSEGLACRNEQVVLTGQYYNEKIAIAYDPAVYEDGAPSPAYFRYDKVGVENDSISDFYLSSVFGGQARGNVRRFPTTEDAVAALTEGEFGAVMGPLTQLQAAAHGGAIKVDTPPLPGLAVGEWTLGVAVRHTYRQLGYAVDDAIRAAIDDGRIEKIFEDHSLAWRKPEW